MSMEPPKTDWYRSSTSAWRISHRTVGLESGAGEAESVECVTVRRGLTVMCGANWPAPAFGPEAIPGFPLCPGEAFLQVDSR